MAYDALCLRRGDGSVCDCSTIGKVVVLLLVGVLLSLSGCGDPAVSDGKVTVGVIRALGTISPYVAERQGFFEEVGLEVELVEFSDGPSMMEAFASGHLDVAYGGLAPAAIWRGRGIPLRIVAATNSGGHVVLTTEDLDLETLSDLKGMKVATPRTGSVTDTLFRAYALKSLAGLDPDGDLEISPGMPPDAMPAALYVTREIDACVTWEPFAAQALDQFDDARVLFNFSQHWKEKYGQSYPVNVVSATESFISDSREALESLLRAHHRTQEFINQEVETANRLIGTELNLSEEVIARARENVGFDFRVDEDQAMTILLMVRDLGYLEEMPNPEDLFYLEVQNGICPP